MQKSKRSHLVKLGIRNLGCIGDQGLEVALDDIVCLVGQNNSGKSTVLRAYELAATNGELRADEVCTTSRGANADAEALPTVELWVHLPEGTANVDAKWKQPDGDLLLVRSKWTWPRAGGRPSRQTWNPSLGDYSLDDKASGLDAVFTSRLPKPFRIGSLDDPAEEHKKLLELVLDPIKAKLTELAADSSSQLNDLLRAARNEAEQHVQQFRQRLVDVQERVNASYQRVFTNAKIELSVALGEIAFDPAAALAKASHLALLDATGSMRWTQQGTGSQRALFWSMLEVRSELGRVADQQKAADKLTKEKEAQLRMYWLSVNMTVVG